MKRSFRTGDEDRGRPVVDDGEQGEQPEFALESPSISLPKGGGAIKGIDEKFTVNPSNGTVSLSLPLPFTPARGGALPPVRIAYDGGAGNSVVGLGWALDLPSIRRVTDHFIPRYDADDVFMLSGVDELVPSATPDGAGWDPDVEPVGTLTVRRYRPRVDGEFARIEQVTPADGASWWRVSTRDNVTTFYGADPGARVAEPGAPEHVYEWLPTISFDDLGNCVVYEYKAEDLANVPRSTSQAHRHDGSAPFANLHLKRVHYGNRTPYFSDEAAPYTAAPAAGEFLFEAVFDYGEHDRDHPRPDAAPGRTWDLRPDPFSSYRAGFEVRTQRLLQRVLMFHRFDELEGGRPTLVRSLDLTHEPASPQTPELAYLASATQTGYLLRPDGEYAKRSLPALEFDYARPEFNVEIRTADPETRARVPAGVTAPAQWVDLFGEGIAGVFSEHEGAWLYASNLGDLDGTGELRLDAQRLVMPKPSFSGVRSGTLTFEDLDADGSRQVVLRSAGVAGLFRAGTGRCVGTVQALPGRPADRSRRAPRPQARRRRRRPRRRPDLRGRRLRLAPLPRARRLRPGGAGEPLAGRGRRPRGRLRRRLPGGLAGRHERRRAGRHRARPQRRHQLLAEPRLRPLRRPRRDGRRAGRSITPSASTPAASGWPTSPAPARPTSSTSVATASPRT